MSSAIQVYPIPALTDNYIWAMVDRSKTHALIVDPGEAQPVNDFLTEYQLSLVGILLTHHHFDHTNGVEELKLQHEAIVIGPNKDGIESLTKAVTGGSKFTITSLGLKFIVLDIGAHTKGHIGFYTPGKLFCGDTLFSAGCGRIFEGTASQMYNSLCKITSLPDDTLIYCAHEYTLANLRFAHVVEPSNEKIESYIERVTTLRKQGLPTLPSSLQLEKEINPFLRCDKPEVIASAESYAGHRLKKAEEVFKWLRKWKDGF